MAFPTGWGRRAALTISAAQIEGVGSLSDFAVLWTVDNLPSEMFDADGSFPALAGGGDVRFSSDEAGSVQVAIDIDDGVFSIDNDPANGDTRIWMQAASIDDSDVFYVWWSKTGETQPAVDAAFGRDAVWVDYEFATHDGLTDVTGNGTITDTGTTAAVGPFGNSSGARRGDSEASDSLTSSQTFATVNEPFTLQSWAYIETDLETRIITLADASSTTQQHNVYTWFDDGGNDFGGSAQSIDGSVSEASTTGEQGQATWRSYAGIFISDSSRKIDVNGGSATGSNTTSRSVTGVDRLKMMVTADSTPFGKQPLRVAEGRFRLDALSDDWIATEYNNQSAPGTFASAGTPETPGGPPAANPKNPLGHPLRGAFAGPIG